MVEGRKKKKLEAEQLAALTDELAHKRVLIVGGGSIGGVVGCRLLEKGLPFEIILRNREVREAWLAQGPSLKKAGRFPLGADVHVHENFETVEAVDLVIVAVQPPQIAEIAAALAPRLASGAEVACLSNGLCEPELERLLPLARVVGAVVTWGASTQSPANYVRTSKGKFIVGCLDTTDASGSLAARVLGQVAAVKFTENLSGARFSKLVFNCAVSTLGTIGGDELGPTLSEPVARALGLEIMTEAVHVAQAEGLRLEKIAGIDPGKLLGHSGEPSRLRWMSQHAVLLAVGRKYKRLRSSMLAGMERGRPPAIDFLNGLVVAKGRERGVETPVNQAACEIVWKIWRNEVQPGPTALEALRKRANELTSAKHCPV